MNACIEYVPFYIDCTGTYLLTTWIAYRNNQDSQEWDNLNDIFGNVLNDRRSIEPSEGKMVHIMYIRT